ncbi:SpaH/EbpB family LPXTG-anchored major pilin [Agrococcus sp. Ld7]|uniref:SpaH/EbpB family LPXTG-anchored major pilin n=1 Tax=Agrococcus sp. Ld7 TaxID=649148 RepID=UPI00386D2B57
MATNKKSLTARVAAGFGAAAIASLIALGGATPAFAAANIDPDVPAAITIHKHEQTGAAGIVGTGSATDPVAGAPIAGVQFSIRQVTNLDVDDNTTWAALSNGLEAADVTATGSTYTLGSTTGTDSFTVTTGDDGTIRRTVPQGVFLVEELRAPAAAGVVIPAQPFLVVVPQPVEATSTWNYDVHVFPKNTVSDALKSLEDFQQEGLGSNLTWDLDIAVPVASEGRSLTSFGVVDVLDARLSHNLATAGAVRVTVGTTTLERGTDFTVALDGQRLSIDFTETGIEALEANADQRVAIEIDTTITALGTGTIQNTASVSINGTEIPSNTASAYFGGIELQKNDDQGAALEGAAFEVVDADGNVVTINGVGEFTSDEDGVVTIAGLRTNADGNATYTVREKSAPAGYQLGSTTEWTIAVPVGTNAAVELTVVNAQVPAYALPVTGGSGQAAFMIGGAGLLLGALGFMLVRRRKAQADA